LKAIDFELESKILLNFPLIEKYKDGLLKEIARYITKSYRQSCIILNNFDAFP